MDSDILKADKTYRDLVWLLYAGIGLASVLFARYGIPAIRGYFYSLGVLDALAALRAVFIVFMLSFIPAAVYLIRVGTRTLEHGCYPYPGRKVMFDTKVVRGDKARKMGKSLIALGTVFLVLMIFSVVFTYFRMGGWINNKEFQKFYGPPSRSALV